MSMHNLTREEEKSIRERTIFTQFIENAGLPVDPNSISSERPPKPDLSCLIEGERHFFEMCEVTDEGLAARFTQAIKTMLTTGGFFRQDRPLLKVFEQKAKKAYETNGGKLEILVYYDRQTPPPAGGLLESTQHQLHLIARSMLSERWSRLWIYDVTGREVLWMADQSMI
jgi:hypothetical protein